MDVTEELFDVLPDMLCAATISGMFLAVNTSFTRILGHRAEDLLAKPFMDFVHQDDRASTQGVVLSLAAGGKIVGFRNRYRKVDGDYVKVDWHAVLSSKSGLIFASGRPVCEAGCHCALAYDTVEPGEMPTTHEALKATLRHTKLLADEAARKPHNQERTET